MYPADSHRGSATNPSSSFSSSAAGQGEDYEDLVEDYAEQISDDLADICDEADSFADDLADLADDLYDLETELEVEGSRCLFSGYDEYDDDEDDDDEEYDDDDDDDDEDEYDDDEDEEYDDDDNCDFEPADFESELEFFDDDDLDFALSIHHEDGSVVVTPIPCQLCNDLEQLLTYLHRLPGDRGALGMISVGGEFFILLRVRGHKVQAVISDVFEATQWNLASELFDFLEAEYPADGFSAPAGDFNMLLDFGCPELELEKYCENYDVPSDEVLLHLADKIQLGKQVRRAIAENDFD